MTKGQGVTSKDLTLTYPYSTGMVHLGKLKMPMPANQEAP